MQVLPSTEHEVVIAGGGPTGLMLAAELALAGVDVVIVERRTSQAVDGSRGSGLHARTLEVLDQRGIVERFVAEGQPMPALGFGGIRLDISDFPSRHNHVLALWQSQFEPILADWVIGLGVPILRDREIHVALRSPKSVPYTSSSASRRSSMSGGLVCSTPRSVSTTPTFPGCR